MKPMPFRLHVLLWLSGIILACLVTIPAKAPAQAAAADQLPEAPTKLIRFADISKDKVVFAYVGDLWIASRDGGAARRLTAQVGDALDDKFSPVATRIAFTREYDGK